LVERRDHVLPLISLAALLGIGIEVGVNAGASVVVVEQAGGVVGLVVDEVNVIRRIPDHAIDPVPTVLQKGRGSAQIDAIGRIAEGGQLISILSPENLFGHPAIANAVSEHAGAHTMRTLPKQADDLEQFLIFQLGEEHYGMPIASVDEVVRVTGDVTRLPGAPQFVLGVMNLRGKAVPLIDQRMRFDISTSAQAAKARAIIVTLGGLQAGFVVDGVSEVKSLSSGDLSAAPEFSSHQTDMFDRIAPIEADGRMILLVDPQGLLTRAERDILASVAQEKNGS
jgi:purine-binding chemotaxis protein CheW